MTSLRRILNMLLAFMTGQGVTMITQLAIPPIFLLRFPDGKAVYGEWVALTAALSYLSSLNYGVQTYAVNQMTILRNRGELAECRTVQASALRLLQWIMLALLPLAALIATLPVADWLHLRHVGNAQARLVLDLFLLQLFSMMALSLLANSFMAVNRAHRGVNWLNTMRLSSTGAIAALAWTRCAFAAMAASQVGVTLLFVLLVLVDLRRTAPEVSPSLALARNDVARRLAAPSWHFSVLSLSTFLTWQAPVLLIQRILGPVAVTVFALTRTVFTMSRQLLAIVSQSIAPEITALVGRKDWQGLRRLYDLSERVVLLLVPTITVGTLLASPFLLAVWLHQRTIYEPGLCFLMALTSAAMGIKEHKYQFQASSNQHEALSRVMLVAYGSVLAVSALTMPYLGVDGFLYAWLAAEAALTVAILRMNRKLFPAGNEITAGPVWRLLAVTAVVFAAAAYPAFHAADEPFPKVLAIAAAFVAGTALVGYKVFGVSEVARILLRRWRRRSPAAPVPQ
jgi:O-antigen/teichoic acid export membrane protein